MRKRAIQSETLRWKGEKMKSVQAYVPGGLSPAVRSSSEGNLVVENCNAPQNKVLYLKESWLQIAKTPCKRVIDSAVVVLMWKPR